MAKKGIGKYIAAAAAIGAAAAGISYFTRYKSFHKELEEDFHGFEDDEELEDESETADSHSAPAERTYVSLNTAKEEVKEAAEDAKEAVSDLEDAVKDAAADIAEPVKEAAEEAVSEVKEAAKEVLASDSTTIVEEE